MIKYYSILLFISLAANNLISSGNRATMCSPDITYNRGAVWNMQAAQDFIPNTRSDSMFNPAFGYWNATNNSNNSVNSAPNVISNSGSASTGEKIQQATGILAAIGGIIAVGKWAWKYVEFGKEVVDVGQQALDLKKQEQRLKERELQQSAIGVQALNEANDLNREINEDAYRAQAAVNSLSIEELTELAMNEMRHELRGTSKGNFFRRTLDDALKRRALINNTSNNNTLPN